MDYDNNALEDKAFFYQTFNKINKEKKSSWIKPCSHTQVL